MSLWIFLKIPFLYFIHFIVFAIINWFQSDQHIPTDLIVFVLFVRVWMLWNIKSHVATMMLCLTFQVWLYIRYSFYNKSWHIWQWRPNNHVSLVMFCFILDQRISHVFYVLLCSELREIMDYILVNGVRRDPVIVAELNLKYEHVRIISKCII